MLLDIIPWSPWVCSFFFALSATTDIYTLSLHDALPICGLSYQPFADGEAVRDVLASAVGIARDQSQARRCRLRVRHEECAVVRGHERRELAHDETGHRFQVFLPLHHPAELRQVRLQPVLLLVALRGLAEVRNHLVDVGLQLVQLSLRVDRDLSREIA